MPIKRYREGTILGSDWDELVNLVEFFATLTNPPDGKYKVTNLYVEVVEGSPKLRVEWEESQA